MLTKDFWDLLLKSATVLFGAFTVYKAFKEFSENRKQRQMDLNWRQAEAAKKLIDDWMEDNESHEFCKMVEYEDRKFKNEEGEEFVTNSNMIRKALASSDANAKTKEEVDKRAVRDRCDSFLYYTEMMSQGEKNNLYRLKDLAFPLHYYLKRMHEKGIYESVKNYAKENHFDCPNDFFDRILNFHRQ